MSKIGDVIEQDGMQFIITDIKVTDYEDGSSATVTTTRPVGE